MKSSISIILILISLTSFGQKLFTNSNGEKCIELYTDLVGPVPQVVCLNIADYYPQLNATDSTVLRRWKQLKVEEKEIWTGEWRYMGYAVEVVPFPITTYLKNQPFIREEYGK